MTHTAAPRPANAVAERFRPEPFAVAAFPQIEAAPYWTPGTCFNPACARRFTPARTWQIYCCAACERAGTAELRRWGHRMAPALLVWRMGKYDTADAAVNARTAAARRYISHAQTCWLQERRALEAGAA